MCVTKTSSQTITNTVASTTMGRESSPRKAKQMASSEASATATAAPAAANATATCTAAKSTEEEDALLKEIAKRSRESDHTVQVHEQAPSRDEAAKRYVRYYVVLHR